MKYSLLVVLFLTQIALSAEKDSPITMTVAPQTGEVPAIADEAATVQEQVSAGGQLPVIPTETKKESEIPMKLDLSKVKADRAPNSQTVLYIVLALSGIAVAGGLLIKKYGLRRKITREVPKMRVIASHALSPKAKVSILEISGEALLIGVTDHSITLLKNLTVIEDEMPEKYRNSFDEAMEDQGVQDDFALQSIAGIEDRVTQDREHYS